ncbi:MAG: PAS-domain containing protein [Geminicoccaceae bacterium]
MTKPPAVDDAELSATLLDQLEVGLCVYDAEDRVVRWNGTYLAFFPEQAGVLAPGVSYAATLRRFFASNLPPSELANLERHVAAGVNRHRTQRVPFVFQRKNGRWLKVVSLPTPDGGRIRMWRDVTVEHGVDGLPKAAQAVAALDVGYAVFDADGRFVTANKRYQELFPDIGDLVQPQASYPEHLLRIAEGARPEHGASTLRQLAQRERATAEPVSLPWLFGCSDGTWLQLEERVGEDGSLVAIWADATRQAEAEARIRRLESYLHDAVEGIPQALLLFDAEQRLVVANRRLALVVPELAAALHEGAPLDSFKAWRASLKAASDGADLLQRLDEPHAAEEIELGQGRWLGVESLRTPAGDLLVLIADISHDKAAQAELQRQREAMHQSEKLAAMGSLLAGVAHELNNPLSIVVGRSALLQTASSDPAIIGQARTIADAANRCARIVRTFLELARQRPPARRSVDLGVLVGETLTLLSYGLRAAGVTVTSQLAEDLPGLWADPDQLAQVLINLVVNAQQALGQRADDRRLDVVAQRGADGGIEIRVADNGPGLDPAVRKRLFEPFFTTKPVGEGTGLGLAISLGHVRAHGGTIDIETTPGGGATFVVRLPLAPAPELQAAAAAEPASPSVRRRVLIVDDEPEIADLLHDILLADGHDVAVVTGGGEALDRLTAERFDLVVSDLTMPGLDGAGLWQAARERDPKAPPFIFLTGDSLRLDRAAGLRDAGCPLLEKPFEPADIRKIVRNTLASAIR